MKPMIELQPFDRDDFTRLISWVPSPEFLLQWSGPLFTWPLDEAQLEAYLQGTEGDPPTRRIYKAVETEAGKVIGHIELNHIDRRNSSAVVSRVLIGETESRGKGYGDAMVRAVVRIGFEELKLHRLELVVFDFNASAIACYERIGFQKEGHLRECRRLGDEYWSLYLMSMLESEWR